MFVLLAVVFAVAAVLLVYQKRVSRMAAVVPGAAALLCLILSMCYVVEPGTIGIEVLLGDIQGYSTNGFHAKNPLANIIRFDARTITDTEVSEGTSQDLQVVKVECAIQYRIDTTRIEDLYTKIGEKYKEKIVGPGLNDAVKASTALYPVEKIITDRASLKKNIEDMLRAKMEPFYLVLQDFQITDIDFSPQFNAVVEAKQIEQQRIKTAEYQKQQAEYNKQRIILEAEAEAQKQQLLRQNTSEAVIQLKWIEKWDGKLPQVVAGDSGVLLNMPISERKQK